MSEIYTESEMLSTLDRVQNSDLTARDKAYIAFLFGFLKGLDDENKRLKESIAKLEARTHPQRAIEKAYTNVAICPQCKSTLKGNPEFCCSCGQKLSYSKL